MTMPTVHTHSPRNKTHDRILFITQFGILLAIEAIVCFTPLGSLPAIGPVVATLSMLPVIVTAVTLGIKAGALMGFFFGLFSFLVWTFMPPALSAPMAFLFTPFYSFGEFQGNFWSLVICFVPRIAGGLLAGVFFKAFSRLKGKLEWLRYGLAGFLGSILCSIMVVGGFGLFFHDPYTSLAGDVFSILLVTTLLTSALPEAVLGGIVGYAVGKPVNKYLNKRD